MTIDRRNFLTRSAAAIAAVGTPFSATDAFASEGVYALLEDAKAAISSNPVTLSILFPQGSINNIKPVAEKFSQATGAKIEFIETTVDDINTHILNAAARQEGNFDIALPATFGIPDLVEAGALEDLTEYSQKHEQINRFEDSLYALGDEYKGKKYGYQTDGDAYLMFYNEILLTDDRNQKEYSDAFGQPLSLPSTWDELDRQMKFFHKPADEQFGGCLFRTSGYLVWEWWIRMHANGGLPVTEDMSADLASDAGVSALEKMIAATEFQHPSATTNGLFENWAEFSKGQCYANIGWGGTQKYLNSNKSSLKGKMLFAPTPEVSYFNWGWNYVVSKYSASTEVAYLFCLFATLPEMSRLAVRGDGFFDPFRAEHYDDPQIVNVYSEPFLSAHKAAMQRAIPDFYIQEHGQYMSVLRENITAAFNGDITPQAALQITEVQWDDITDNIGRESQIQQWKFLLSQYP